MIRWVEVIEDWVEPEIYQRWHKLQAEAELRYMETREFTTCAREEFFAAANIEPPAMTTTPSGGE